jgi:hypothetical protein
MGETTNIAKARKPRPHKHQWQNDLQSLKNRYDQKRTPNAIECNGEEIRGKWEDETANGLTRAIVDFFQYIGGHFTRVNVMGTPRKRSDGSMFFTPSTTREGTADIVGVYNGRYVAVEVKIGLDRQSKDQKEVQKEIEQAGGIYIVAKTFPQFTDEFRKYLLSPIS